VNRVRRLRRAARAAGYRLHYDNVGDSYSLHGPGPEDFYGLTLEQAEARFGLSS
jgi:hypothetical protein